MHVFKHVNVCEHVCIFLCLCQSHRSAQVSFLLINFSAFEILASSQFSLLMQPSGLVNMTYAHDKKSGPVFLLLYHFSLYYYYYYDYFETPVF